MKMSPPKNGIYIITGEISLVVTAMKRNSRWTSHSHQVEEQDPLLNSFSQLKDILNHIPDLEAIEANVFLGPFLDVIRSEDTTGPITGLALTSINKFLSYGLIEAGHETSAAAIENIADAVTHARFVGTDPGSDEVVLMKILHVLRTLLLSPAGTQLTNESVCEIMQSCFRICFEMRLSELLRKSAENTLMDMVQLLFSRLPQFKEDAKWALNMKKLKMRAGSIDPRNKKKRHLAKGKLKKPSLQPVPEPKHNPNMDEQSAKETLDNEDANTVYASNEQLSEIGSETKENSTLEEGNVDGICIYPQIIATTPVAPGDTVVDIHESFKEASERDTMEEMKQERDSYEPEQKEETDMANSDLSMKEDAELDADSAAHAVLLPVATESQPSDSESTAQGDASMDANEDYVNPKGVRFVPQQQTKEGHGPLIPYGLPCVRELFRFLISLINPYDRHNTDIMIHMGLTLLTAALESGADYVAYNNSLLMLVRDELCKNLFSLLQSERLSLFAGSLRVCFLLFESLRSHLKLQLEMYLTKLSSIIVSDSIRIGLEQREIALESVVQLWRIPGLVTELYLNYDCDLYCSNLFEDLTKLLSKNAFPVSGLFSTHLLSLDALLTVVDTVEQHCHSRILNTKAKESEKASDGSDSDSGWSSLPVSGYAVGQKILAKSHSDVKSKLKELNRTPQIRPNRMSVSTNLPSVEELAAIKQKKRLLIQGTEHFNTKPAKGITFLQEHGLLATPLDPDQVATFLKEDYKLDKKMIAEYICKKTNKAVLESFVYSYEFTNKRLDEALRMFLESFRLPGESPVISYLMEYFSEHWHQSNGNPFVNTDAAFTLTYAVIMLNVDQHNHNAKKQNIPMTIEEFKKNVSKCNGGNDFEAEMLEEIYYAIKSDEIVMPAEQTGIVKENYLWNVLLRRGATKEGSFVHAPTGSYDHDLFVLIWGPTVAALSFVFDKSLDETIVQKAISGFRKCAMISAHYGISDVFDNLVITLCKFTTLLSISECPDTVPVLFGQNMKAQLAAKTVFALAHRHADILREGWKNILDCMLQLYKAKLLPKTFIEVEDFLDPSGKLALIKEENASLPRTESGVLSYFSSYFSSEAPSQKGPSPEEQEVIKLSHACIKECDLEQLITETKFLRMDSLQELIKALIFASQSQDSNEMSPHGDEEAAVFFLELLIRVVLQNRDRVGPFWQSVRDHICNLMVNAEEHTFLVERAVVGLIRLAKRLLRRDEIASQVLLSLRMLLLVKPKVIHSVCRHVSYGIHELLRTNAANIHSAEDWYTLFTLLEIVGAGAHPPAILPTTSTIVDSRENMSDAGAQSDSELSSQPPTESDRGYTSDSELYDNNKHRSSADLDVRPILGNGSWLLVNKDEPEGTSTPTKKQDPVNQYNIAMNEPLGPHDTKSLVKSCETLAFIVRDTVHVTPHNFESCIHAIRVFVEASMDGGVRNKREPATPTNKNKKHHKGKRKDEHRMKKSRSMPLNTSGDYSDDEDDAKTGAYHSISIQLLDLMHTLHTRAASIFGSWAEEEKNIDQSKQSIDAGAGALWLKCWCPILQGIARLCCDVRRQVRSQALTYLQRALLVHDLQTLSAIEWESCFNKVLFPLLHMLLANVSPADPGGVEETRMRGSTLLCKVFLQHLSPLLSLSTFTALWLTILDFMDKYMHADKSDLLFEAIPESLKNMLLVMDTASIFQNEGEQSQLWRLTWDRIDTFLPHLKDELFKTDQEPRLSNEKHLESSKDTQPLPTERAEEPKMPQEAADPPVVRAASPLMEENHTPVTGGYVLHPPLPTVSSVQIPASLAITHTVPTVPLLLNPDIIQAASIPYLSPQNTPERKQEAITSKQ